MTRPSFVLPIVTVVLVLAAGTKAGRGRAPLGADAITETQLRNDLSFIASDALEGRRTPLRGLDAAAAFLASRLGRLGLQPAGDEGTFLQTIALTRRRLDDAKTSLAVGSRGLPNKSGSDTSLAYGEDFLPGELPGTAEGQVVYVGNGSVIRSRGVNPFKDMIGRGRAPGTPVPSGALALTDTGTVYVVGPKRLSAELGAAVEEANARYHGLRLDDSLDARDNPGEIYRRSDHYQYAKRGIPVAFFFTGAHEDYHALDDEVDRIDFGKLRQVTQTIYATARLIADAKQRPALDAVTAGPLTH